MANDENKIPEFWYEDPVTRTIYNLSLIQERYRMRGDLKDRGFFIIPQFSHLWGYFDLEQITQEKFNELFTAIRMYNTVVLAKIKGKIVFN